MIHRNDTKVQSLRVNSGSKVNWQQLLADCITDPAELLRLLNLPSALLKPAGRAVTLFPLRVTRSYVARMQKEDLHDPLLRQVLPLKEELADSPNYSHDPLEETSTNKIPGLLHKYKKRVLIIASGGCAIHCRYCFRRCFPYAENNPGQKGLEKIFGYISADPTINEVILSGGDPLAVSDKRCAYIIEQLNEIKHIKRLRIHTRMPIVLPERITDNMITCLKKSNCQVILVLHCNHPNEIDSTVGQAIERLRSTGITLFNQSVLLKGVNDNSDCLEQLSEKLFAHGVLPYYLHLLDKVKGSAHFAVSLNQARQLYRDLLARLPGYLVPKLVYDAPNASSKVLVTI